MRNVGLDEFIKIDFRNKFNMSDLGLVVGLDSSWTELLKHKANAVMRFCEYCGERTGFVTDSPISLLLKGGRGS